jgi:hypothetical protein
MRSASALSPLRVLTSDVLLSNMRPVIMLIASIGTAVLCTAQNASPPVPFDSNDPLSENGPTLATAADHAQALELLNRAKLPMRLQMAATPPYLLTVSFTAAGSPENSGPGQFSELWLGARNWRWSATFGDFQVTRIRTSLGTFDEKPVGLVPMRVHMLRNAIFWAAQGLTANSQFRRAEAEWNGRATTCLLISDRPNTGEPAPRRWDESEYCIDNQTNLLQVLSVSPGSYTVYSYSGGVMYHGNALPDRIRTYLAGSVVLDASLRVEEPPAAHDPLTVTPEMIAAGFPVGLDEPYFASRVLQNAAGSGGSGVMVVHAQLGPDGKIFAEEPSTNAELSFTARALEAVKQMEFGGLACSARHTSSSDPHPKQ